MSDAYKNLHHENIMARLISGVVYCIFACFLLHMVLFCSQLYAKSTSLDNICLPAEIENSVDSLQNDLYPQPRKNDRGDSYEIPLDLSYRLPHRLEEDIMDKKVITIDDLIKDYQKHFLQPMIEEDYKPDKSDRAIMQYVESLPSSSQTVFSNDQTSQDETILPISKLAKTFCPLTSEVKPLDITNRWVWNDNELEREKIKIKEDYFSRDHELNKAIGRTLPRHFYEDDESSFLHHYSMTEYGINYGFIFGGLLQSRDLDYLYVGTDNTEQYTQTEGNLYISMSMYLGYDTGSSGTFNLQGGLLDANQSIVGVFGEGKFHQTGGSSSFVRKYIGYMGNGEVNIENSARFSAGRIYNGYMGKGSMTQGGEAIVSAREIYLGYGKGSSGIYAIGGMSTLIVNEFIVGYHNGSGTLRIDSSDSSITVRDNITFTRNGSFKCAEGVDSAKIKLESARFSISSDNPSNFTDFDKLTLEFIGTGNSIEVASQDLGTFMDNPNYLFNGIVFSGGGVVSLVLTDYFDNDLADDFNEALYVRNIVVEENTQAVIQLYDSYNKAAGNLNIYGDTITIGAGGSITLKLLDGEDIVFENSEDAEIVLGNGMGSISPRQQLSIPVQAVPEPAVCFYMLAGIAWILRVKSLKYH